MTYVKIDSEIDVEEPTLYLKFINGKLHQQTIVKVYRDNILQDRFVKWREVEGQ